MDRPSVINLPEFDRLRREAVYARNAFPPSSYTIFSMPALTLGRLIGYADQRNKDTLVIRDKPGDPLVKWGAGSSTIFSEARAGRIQLRSCRMVFALLPGAQSESQLLRMV